MIPHYKKNTPFITTEQMIEVDRIMMEDLGISLTQMMENAGLNLAILARDVFLKNELKEKKVIVIAGSGGNGGGALVAARRLASWGAEVSVLLSSAKGSIKKETKQQLEIIKNLNIPMVDKIHSADLIMDGMIGYSVSGNPKTKVAELIESVNTSGIPVLSLDTPSGLDLTTGVPGKPTIKANATMTIALPKLGLYKMKASKLIGDLYLADISVPPQVYKSFDIDPSQVAEIFLQGTVIKINKMVVFS